MQANHMVRCLQNPVKDLRWNFLQKYLMAFSRQLFSQKAPSKMVHKVLNTLLIEVAIDITGSLARAL